MALLFLLFFLLLLLSLSSFNVFCTVTVTKVADNNNNPLTARASAIRYWKFHISGNLPPPPFLLSKTSPLNDIDLAKLARITSQNNLSSNLNFFCSSANLLCSLDKSKPGQDPNFSLYSAKSFSLYGSSRLGGVGSFKNYSDGVNTAANSFKEYSRDSVAHTEGFKRYAGDVNVADDNFTNYGSDATGGSGEFAAYQGRAKRTRKGKMGKNSSLILIKSFRELEGIYLDYLSVSINKKLVPVGPLIQDPVDDPDGDFEFINWLDKKNPFSTVFVSFGSEYLLSNEEIEEIAHGLEQSKVNFIWVIRFPKELGKIRIEDVIPESKMSRGRRRGEGETI